MQEVNSVDSAQQINPTSQESNVVETTQTGLSTQKPKSNSFLISLLSVLLLIACIVAGFFAYQTQTLVKELTAIKSTTEPTPTATSLPTEIPTATESGVVDGMKNWKTYMGDEFAYSNNIYKGYEFKYPSFCVLQGALLNCEDGNNSFALIINAGGHGLGQIVAIGTEQIKSYPLGEVKVSYWKNVDDGSIGATYWISKTKDLSQDYLFGFEIEAKNEDYISNIKNTLDQILSTFKFTK